MLYIKVIIDFLWSAVNLPISFGSVTITFFQVISFSVVLGLVFRLLFSNKGGGKSE